MTVTLPLTNWLPEVLSIGSKRALRVLVAAGIEGCSSAEVGEALRVDPRTAQRYMWSCGNRVVHRGFGNASRWWAAEYAPPGRPTVTSRPTQGCTAAAHEAIQRRNVQRVEDARAFLQIAGRAGVRRQDLARALKVEIRTVSRRVLPELDVEEFNASRGRRIRLRP